MGAGSRGYIPGVSGRIFLLSPASLSGTRARMLFKPGARSDLAARLRGPEGAPIGEVFTYLSGLYFRGKLAYALEFARPPEGSPGIFVITTGAGLLPAHQPVTLRRLRRFAEIPIDVSEPLYRRPLARASRELAGLAPGECEIVLLGSIASGKYVDILGKVFGERLVFPADFVGRGDMSRGGLMLRRAREGRELDYTPVLTAVRHGPRPPKLPRLPRLP
jgi:hypothetical protein